ncbi:MAG: cell envelope integrity protein CreD [Cyclobacteriaceae bacterium]|nr:cell envelope integrity protein CreD [Cyclobacteriaceae bacterium]
MEQQNPVLNLSDRLNQWIRESVTIKLASIGFLVLLLLIPSSWIQSLIQERQQRAAEVIHEIASKWSGPQTVAGPVLVVPFVRYEKIKHVQNGIAVEEVNEIVERAYFLPDKLGISGTIAPQVRHRGIFDAVVYDASLNMQASFESLDFTRWNIPDNQVRWKEAAIMIGINDLRGISENPVVKLNQKPIASEPQSQIGVDFNDSNSAQTSPSGISANPGWASRDDVNGQVDVTLQIKGSERLYLVPVGKTTTVSLSGSWGSPSFEGAFLPTQQPEISDNGFTAGWKVLSFNRPFQQQWVGDAQQLGGSSFGVRLELPADQYQKSIRTAKYGQLIIILAFTALFLVEITSRIRIHPFQYILVGVALIIYYTLLLSLSEHVGYDVAYAIASFFTIGLVSFYATTFLPKRQLVILFSILMSIFYLFIFVIIQAQDFSLLLGSIGLFMIVAAIMYFSRNIKWYRDATAG